MARSTRYSWLASPPYASASSGLIKNSLLCLKFGALMDCRNFFLQLDLCLFTVDASS